MITNPRRTAAVARLLLDPHMDKPQRAIIAHILKHGAFKDPTEEPDSGWYVGIGTEGDLRFFARKTWKTGVAVDGSMHFIARRIESA